MDVRSWALSLLIAIGGVQLVAAQPCKIDAAAVTDPVTAEFYRRRDWNCAWRAEDLRSLVRALDGLAAHGLDPERYDRSRIRDGAWPAIETLATGAALAYARTMVSGALDPDAMHAAWDFPRPAADFAQGLETALANHDLAAWLSSLIPNDAEYAFLMSALERYRGQDGQATQIDQIRANLERRRWIAHVLPSTRIEVNIADQSGVVVEGGREILKTKVIIGSPKHPTPLILTRAREVILNPPWVIPRSIIAKEILPKLKRNPNYLAENHMYWDAKGRLIQAPGPDNALGRVKLELTDRFDVYMHDTSAPKLFARKERALSHGCVRVEKPLELATWLLRDQPGWGRAALEKGIEEGTTRHIPLRNPVAVWLNYRTVFADEFGQPAFRSDLYGWDAALIEALDGKKGPISPAVATTDLGCPLA